MFKYNSLTTIFNKMNKMNKRSCHSHSSKCVTCINSSSKKVIEYNDLLKSYNFYEQIPYEHIFIVEMDSYLRKPLDETMFQYDYVAAPYGWDETSAGGGMSYRKRSVMLDI